MIAHIAEVWLALAVAFVIGCVVGTVLFRLTARSSLGAAQLEAFDALAGVGKRMRHHVSVSPGPRDRHRLPAAPRAIPGPQTDRAIELEEAVAGDPLEAEVDDDAAWFSGELDVQDAVPVEDRREDEEPELSSHMPRLPADTESIDEPVAEPAADRAADDQPATAARFEEDEWASPSGTNPPSDDNRLGMRRPLLVGDAAPAEPKRSAASDSRRPATLLQPRNGVPDNLQRIKGIGERNEVKLNQLGIFHFSQIASWTPAEIRWVGEQLAFPERIEDDDWVGQAIVLASGGETGFTKSSERRRARRRTAREAAPDQDPEDQA